MVEENGLVAGEGADAGVMTIKVMLVSRANRAGSFLVSWKQPDAHFVWAGTASKKTKGGIVNAARTINF